MPLLKTSMGQNALCYRGVKLWNELSGEAKLAHSCKKYIKQMYFKFHFDCCYFNKFLSSYKLMQIRPYLDLRSFVIIFL